MILVRYGELYLKGNNRSFFENCLINNIRLSLINYKPSIRKAGARFFIDNYDINSEEEIIDRLTKVFGIHSVSPAKEITTEYSLINNTALLLAPNTGTFKVIVNRADKRLNKTSMQIASDCGAFILNNKPALRVDVINPEHEIIVDIRENNKTYVMSKNYKALGGMPVGSAGKGMLLLSGGIDSPVAAYMMAKRGLSLYALHFHSYPYTSERAKDKVIELTKIISQYANKIELNIVSLTEIQQEIHMKCPTEYMITIVRRFMMRIANILSKERNCGVLVTGESLGQVASQTIESINVISAVSSIEILRPLIGMDKSEIINIANTIGTYNISIEPYEDCCTVFLPKNPVIRPKKDLIEKAEQLLEIDKLISNAMNTLKVINIQ